jgi:metal-dependent amidase/aminoacylase/carboxypeptidase family protein
MMDHAALIALRRALHRCPELAFQERETIRTLQAFLRARTSLKLVDREGWFYAVKEGKHPAAPPIAFRADMDALPMDEGVALPHASRHPGVSHKCGHDGHCAALCAPLLSEQGAGEVYAFHSLSGYPEGQVLYRRGLTQPASEGLTIRLTGRASHASAPEEGRSPAETAARLVLEARKLTERPHRGMVLCTVTGIQVGTGDYGISPGEGALRLTLRAEEEAELQALEQRLRQCAETLAARSGLTVTFAVSDYFPETRNHDLCLDRVLAAAETLDIPHAPMEALWRASEDFGWYTKRCPGAMFYLGSGINHPPLHTAEFDFNDRLLPVAAALFHRLATG